MNYEDAAQLKAILLDECREDEEKIISDVERGVMTQICPRCFTSVAFWRSKCPLCLEALDR